MPRLRTALDRGLGWLLAGLMAVAVVNVLWQVFTRYVLNDPSSGTEELARYLLIWIALLGAAYASGQGMHLALDLLPQRLSGRSQLVLRLVIDVCIVAFAIAVLGVGGTKVVLGVRGTSPAFGIHLGIVYAVLPIAGAIIAAYTVLDVIDRARACRPKP